MRGQYHTISRCLSRCQYFTISRCWSLYVHMWVDFCSWTVLHCLHFLPCAGEMFAVAHPHKATGYKAHKWEAKFDATTSYSASFSNQVGPVCDALCVLWLGLYIQTNLSTGLWWMTSTNRWLVRMEVFLCGMYDIRSVLRSLCCIMFCGMATSLCIPLSSALIFAMHICCVAIWYLAQRSYAHPRWTCPTLVVRRPPKRCGDGVVLHIYHWNFVLSSHIGMAPNHILGIFRHFWREIFEANF